MYLSDVIEAVDISVQYLCKFDGKVNVHGYNSSSKIQVADRKSKKWKERLQSVGFAQSSVEVKIGNRLVILVNPGKLAKLWYEVISSWWLLE